MSNRGRNDDTGCPTDQIGCKPKAVPKKLSLLALLWFVTVVCGTSFADGQACPAFTADGRSLSPQAMTSVESATRSLRLLELMVTDPPAYADALRTSQARYGTDWIDTTVGRYRYKIFRVNGGAKREARVYLGGIGTPIERTLRHRYFLQAAAEGRNLILLEMPGQGETNLEALRSRLSGASGAKLARVAGFAVEAQATLAKMSDVVRRGGGEAEFLVLQNHLRNINERLADELRVEMTEASLSTAFRDRVRGMSEALKRLAPQASEIADRYELIALSWGGWFAAAYLAQPGAFLPSRFTALDPGVGILASGLNPALNLGASFARSTSGFFGGFGAFAPYERVIRATADGTWDWLVNYSGLYDMNALDALGAQEMVMALHDQEPQGLILRWPRRIPFTLVLAPEGGLVPPVMSARLAQAARARNSTVIAALGQPHELVASNDAQLQALMTSEPPPPGVYAYDGQLNAMRTSAFDAMMARAQRQWEASNDWWFDSVARLPRDPMSRRAPTTAAGAPQ